MTDRDRLKELLKQAQDKYFELRSEYARDSEGKTVESFEDFCADHLLANGVIVPPCKVGQTVYVLGYDEETSWVYEYKVKYFYCSSKGINRIYIECGTMGNNFRPKDIGKTVFLTKEEAEAKLRERKDDEGK